MKSQAATSCLSLVAAVASAFMVSVSSAEVSPAGTTASVVEPAYDLVIRNGRVLDGAGNPWVRADVAVKDGRIARIGRVSGRGKREIDAAGHYVSPGFIDMMDQSARAMLTPGAGENKLRMGVTTLISGEGGTAPAPEIPSYFAKLEKQGIALNFAAEYSTQQARQLVMGDKAGAPTPEQLGRMREQVAMAMQAGVFGVTTALVYPPMSYESTQELIELAKPAGACGGFYSTHMRDEASDLLKAIAEAIEIGEKSGTKVEIYHLKASYAPGWGKLMPQALKLISDARDRGVDVAADLYPYQAGGTGLSITVPNWVFADGEARGWERLRDPKIRERLKAEVLKGSQPGWSNFVESAGGWEHVMLANAHNPRWDKYRFQMISTIAKAEGRHPADVAWDIVLDGLPERVLALFFMMDEHDIEQALAAPFTSIGTDASSTIKYGGLDDISLPHPRSYATFPRVLAEYVKRRHVLTLEQAVRKMTSWPATRMGLNDRGVLREGLKADLTVFDLDRMSEGADWEHPTTPPQGIEYVVVNGQVALDPQGYTGVRAGEVLRHACSKASLP
jgi:N-acyl-D-amino-acid deacylase